MTNWKGAALKLNAVTRASLVGSGTVRRSRILYLVRLIAEVLRTEPPMSSAAA
jgi:hypothetical protein